MAAVAEMGEVDEMRSKDEGGVLTNGDLSNDVDMDDQDCQSSVKKVTASESMEVDDEIKAASEEDTNLEENSNSADNHSEINEDESSQETKISDVQSPSEDQESSQGKPGSEDQNEPASEDQEMIETPTETEISQEIEEVESDSKQSENLENADTEDNIETVSKSNINEEDIIHEIEESDDDDDLDQNIANDETIELNDSGGEDDVTILDSPKQNGTEIIDLVETPEKKAPESATEKVTPRRSSRNLNKSKSYVELEKEEERAPVANTNNGQSEESDIEEVLPQDPLACNDAITVERIPIDKTKQATKTSTIVVKDTKRLVEIASKSNSSTPSQGKKEPTLVIIDTNSILSGKGPIPVNNKTLSSLNSSTYPTVLPMAVPAQGMYPPNMRATITPIPMNSTSISTTPTPKTSPATITPTINPAMQVPPLLPSLTDDMFVVEAPSFIVPYVYEKPASKDIKEFIKEIEKEVKENEKNKNENDADSKDGKEDKDGEDVTSSEKDANKKDETEQPKTEDSKKSNSYFDSPLGKFFINIGFNLVQEQVQSDLLKQQKRKANREGGSNPETEKTIKSLTRNLEFSKENNKPFNIPIKRCEFCNFKTESGLVMSYHLETPHMKNFVYKCNFCSYEVRSPHDILFHMEAEHTVRGHLERAPAFHQCPNCPFEDNQKGKLSRHLVACMRKFKPDRNLEPPVDWEPPAKIPRVPKMRQQGLSATAAAFQGLTKTSQYQFLSKMNLTTTQAAVLQRGRGRPTIGPTVVKQQTTPVRSAGMVFKQQGMSGGSLLMPTNYQLSGNQVFQVVGGQDLSGRLGNAGQMFLPNMPSASSGSAVQNVNSQNSKKPPAQQPSISITPLPRNTTATVSPVAPAKPGDTTSKNTFVICEICDGYIKDLEQLRNHMQWIHKIKIHPKMIYNRPPLNCQKCQFRFFTDQGLERHLLGSHGLVTSSMQEAANKSKDSGRCPVCGRVYQWKLLNHVARDHNMTLKPAHLSYKCTVCTATFGMYKQFENHVYSAHSVVAKRVMDKKSATGGGTTASPSNKSSDQMKSLKINDEITIIPQPTKTNGSTSSPSTTGSGNSKNSGTPSTSKNPETTTSASRAERLARRNANGEV